MYDKALITTVGRWFALVHAASRRFQELHPEVAKKV
jgi:hypothetical protein